MDVNDINRLLKVLTWRKIVQLVTLLGIVGITYAVWDSRAKIYTSSGTKSNTAISQLSNFRLSKSSIDFLDISISKNNIIIGIQIYNVNFKKNTRSIAFLSTTDLKLRSSYNAYENNKIIDMPIFTDTQAHNQQIINLINGEFSCATLVDTSAFDYYGDIRVSMPYVCYISIPEYYGRFAGYMEVYLRRSPSADDIESIHQMAREISLKIFQNDIENK